MILCYHPKVRLLGLEQRPGVLYTVQMPAIVGIRTGQTKPFAASEIFITRETPDPTCIVNTFQ